MLEQIEKTIYKVAIYIRLSKEDVDRGYDESESIKNQRTLLTEYVQKLGWKYQLVNTYIDQGFTGTNFNRPDFQKMVTIHRVSKKTERRNKVRVHFLITGRKEGTYE